MLRWQAGSLFVACAVAQTFTVVRAHADAKHRVHIVGTSTAAVVNPERGQVGVQDIKIAADRRSVGWLEQYPGPLSDSPVAAKLAIWRDGKIIRTFPTDQSYWSWAFVPGGGGQGLRVAFHTGPLHGERASHCELRDAITGRVIADWDGDLEDAARPSWVKRLSH